MTLFEHSNEHNLDCICTYCSDVDPNKSISRELERYVEELVIYSHKNLTAEQALAIHQIVKKITLMHRYFPIKELPLKHQRLLDALDKD
jgi:thioredoxin reductase